MIACQFVLISLLACAQPAEPEAAPVAANAPVPPLSIDRIFSSGEFQEEGQAPFHWSLRAPAYFTLTPAVGGRPGRNLVRHDLEGGAEAAILPADAMIPPGAKDPLSVDSFVFSSDESKVLIYTNSRKVWRRNTRGDYWVIDLVSRDLKKLGGEAAPSTLMFAKFSPDGTRVAYVRENNIYVQDLRGMGITALTADGSPRLINGTADWVNEEELDIRDGYRWSPDGRSIAFWQFDTTGVSEFHLIDNTKGLYPQITSFPYPKVGERNSATRLGVVGADGGGVRWLDVPGDAREHYLPRMEWTPDGAQLLIQQFNRIQDTNRVMLADPSSGSTRTILTETDPAWLENENPVRWLGKGRDFLWVSERDGWRHAYVAGDDGRSLSLVTSGDFDMIEFEALDDAGGWLYFAASPENATQRYLYRAPLRGGGAPERLTPAGQPGWHTYDVSPDSRWAVHTYSTFVTPPVVELIRLPDHTVARTLVDNKALRAKLAGLSVEFLRVEIGQGQSLDAWCLKPPGMDQEAKHPLLFHVYGEPHGQTVRDAWQGRQLLWHWMLVQQGYIVASVDNRGTMAPRGRAWRKSVHRQIGILASEEQAAAARALLQRWPFADPARVGIWGWSGGGSMSLNALFREPDLYRTAIAVAPNADQLLYDSIYQERYMGLPKDNVAGYRDGSPLTFAHQLKGNLLVVHGTGDDNGHFQGTERLMNELIAHGKHFTVMPYPARSHGIYEGRNTTQHFYGLLTRYLNENLPPNPGVAAKPVQSALQNAGMRTRDVAGWTVHVSESLLANDAAATDRALVMLKTQLEEIVRVVPSAAVAELRKVPLWLSCEYPGIEPKAEYHPSADWLRQNGRDPAMAKSVEFTNVRIFEAETRRMPNFALHELAHAYHDRVLPDGFDNKQVVTAYKRANVSGTYDLVEQQLGGGETVVVGAYAMTNSQEYFAESTEAYFGANDFFPCTRDDLKRHDPEMVALLERLWGINVEPSPAPSNSSTSVKP